MFPISWLPADLKDFTIKQLAIEDSLKLLKVNKGLRHRILHYGPFPSKRPLLTLSLGLPKPDLETTGFQLEIEGFNGKTWEFLVSKGYLTIDSEPFPTDYPWLFMKILSSPKNFRINLCIRYLIDYDQVAKDLGDFLKNHDFLANIRSVSSLKVDTVLPVANALFEDFPIIPCDHLSINVVDPSTIYDDYGYTLDENRHDLLNELFERPNFEKCSEIESRNESLSHEMMAKTYASRINLIWDYWAINRLEETLLRYLREGIPSKNPHPKALLSIRNFYSTSSKNHKKEVQKVLKTVQGLPGMTEISKKTSESLLKSRIPTNQRSPGLEDKEKAIKYFQCNFSAERQILLIFAYNTRTIDRVQVEIIILPKE